MSVNNLLAKSVPSIEWLPWFTPTFDYIFERKNVPGI